MIERGLDDSQEKLKDSPDFHISRSGRDCHFRSAAAHRALQFTSAHRALHGDRQIGMDRPGAGVNVQIESVSGADRQTNGARSGMQLPAAGDVSIGADVAAASTRAQSALYAAQLDSPRTGLGIHIARAGKCGFNVAASGVTVERGRDILRANSAASGLHMDPPAEIAQPDVTRTSLCLHFSANALDAD